MTTTTHPTTTHSSACRAHAIGCAVENIRDAKADPIVAKWAATADPVAEGDRYLSEGLASCLCGTDAKWAASWVLLGLAALDEAAEAAPAPTSYVVTNDARAVPRHVSTDYVAALAWAQAAANRDLAARPNEATPHYVVTPWNGTADEAANTHVYGTVPVRGEVAPVRGYVEDTTAPVCAAEGCELPAVLVGSVGDRAYRVHGVPLCGGHAAAEGPRFTVTRGL